MPIPSKHELKAWAENYVALWNAGDKAAWEANWRKVGPGEFRMLDPVGTPEKVGFQHCCLDSFDLFQARVQFRIPEGMLFVCDNEVAWTLENTITTDGKTTKHYSIETYRFEEDGSVTIRTYYRVPARTPDELGEMFQTYLPE
ncbi:MAG: hypothetical protein ACJZ7Z_04225 [Myxococcota bacterium]|nr:hypothetical protein [Spirochaeta sp.]RPG04803.1 MAG: hypothetical protein CBC32_013705 [Proteobacteria bacterium TMED72]